MTRGAGIKNVALHAGVSVATVSYVINKPDRVSPKTRERVHESMRLLGFVRNEPARYLRAGRSNTIGMLMLSIENPFFAEFARFCQERAERDGFAVIFGSSDQDLIREQRYLQLFEEQRVHGLLVAPVDGPTDGIRELAKRGMPLVLLDAREATEEFCSVAMDGHAAGALAINHLAATGRRRILLLGGPEHQLADRWSGAREAASQLGLEVTTLETTNQTIGDGLRAGETVAAMPPHGRPDGVLAGNDLLALGLIQALQLDQRLAIPQDISVVGVDDIPQASTASVPLTTVAQPKPCLADIAFTLLSEESRDGRNHLHRRELVQPHLVIRQSSPAVP